MTNTCQIISLNEVRNRKEGIQGEFEFMSEKVTKTCGVTLKIPLKLDGLSDYKVAEDPKPKPSFKRWWKRMRWQLAKAAKWKLTLFVHQKILDRRRKAVSRELAVLMDLGTRLSREREFEFFMEFAGQVDLVRVYVWQGGWQSANDIKNGKGNSKAREVIILERSMPSTPDAGRYRKVLTVRHVREAVKTLRGLSRVNDLFMKD